MVAKKVLIVDDEREMVDLLRMRLEASGYQVFCAYDGKEGLDKAIAEKPEVVILDVMMPKMNGYQVCRELKANEETKNIFVIILSAKSQDSDKFWGKETGADDYVTKPFEAKELLAKIKSRFGE